MAKYILSKKAKGKKYQYTVTDEKGNVISTRTSARDYVAFGEYPAGVIEEITYQTGYYGDIYQFCYCAAQMALEKMNPRT
jgi:hypothetical protein